MCKNLSRTKLKRPISQPQFNFWNDFVVRDKPQRINNSRYALSIMNKLLNKHGKFGNFQTPRT